MVKVIFRWSNRGNSCWCYYGCYYVSPYHWRTIRYTWVCKGTNERHKDTFAFPGFSICSTETNFPFKVKTCFLDSGIVQCINLHIIFKITQFPIVHFSVSSLVYQINKKENRFQTRKSNGMFCICVLNVYPH